MDAKRKDRSVSKLRKSLKELQSESFVFQMNIYCHGYKMTFTEVKAILIPIQSIPTSSNMCLNYGVPVSKNGSEISLFRVV